MSDDFILTGKNLKYAKDGDLPTIRISKEAYNILVDMANESGLSISKVASKAVMYANEHLRYERKGGECDGKDNES